MVDVSGKAETQREAVASGRVIMAPQTFRLIQEGGLAKGDVLAVAQVAGIMAAKQTPGLIPMCHPLNLTSVSIGFHLDEAEHAVEISATVKTRGKTGVEMEALTSVAVCALTIYDMCKAVDPAMRIEGIRLVRKKGGKSGVVELG
jgi:cyclic pyranopterin phosphate synthase